MLSVGLCKRRRGSLRSPLGRAKTGGKGIRTPDLLIANETLYQLSYTPKEEQRLSWRNDFSASDSENSEQRDLLLSLRETENEPAKFTASEFCGRSGVIECVLFGHVAGPVRLDSGTLVTLPAARKGRISMIVCRCCIGLVDCGRHAANESIGKSSLTSSYDWYSINALHCASTTSNARESQGGAELIGISVERLHDAAIPNIA